MQILRHFTAGAVQLEQFPFKRELAMEAYLLENEGVLALDDDTFSEVEIIEDELSIEDGRQSKRTDGRIDILAKYSDEYIAVIELKIGQLNEDHLAQLEDYLKARNKILEKYTDIFDPAAKVSPKWIGILVGSAIDLTLATKLTNGYSYVDGTSVIQIAALTIQRFRSHDGHVYVTTDTYFRRSDSVKDASKYGFEGKSFGKGKLVLAAIKHYVESKPKNSLTYSDMESVFNKKCQGSLGVFEKIERANEIFAKTERKRHFLKPEELIKLSDCTVAVCSQWGVGNIKNFINAFNAVSQQKIDPAF